MWLGVCFPESTGVYALRLRVEAQHKKIQEQFPCVQADRAWYTLQKVESGCTQCKRIFLRHQFDDINKDAHHHVHTTLLPVTI